MDANVAVVLVAVVTGVFGVITAILNNNQKKVVEKVKKQTLFVKKEKGLKQKLNQKEKEREKTIHDVMLLILDTNLSILKNQNPDVVDDEVFKKSDELKARFTEISETIDDLYQQYDIVLSMTEEFENDLVNKKK